METTRKAKFVRQIWLTAVSLALVAIVIFVLSLNFAQTNSNAGASCAPTATPVVGPKGLDGLSAYDLWVSAGNTGTKAEFLTSLVGKRGPRGYTGSNGVTTDAGFVPVAVDGGSAGESGAPGEPGSSAYQLWLNAGNVGEPEDFLISLIGTAGANGIDGAVGPAGIDGLNGLSAYELWLSNGNTGDTDAFLSSLVGAPGAPGQDGQNGADGTNGLSAYEIWLSAGNAGTEEDFVDSLRGAPGICSVGDQGHSAYDIWLAQGNSGTEQDFLDSLKGAAGSGGLPYNGSFFDTTTQLNSSSTNLMRFNTTDPWTVGVRVNSSNNSRIYFDHPGVYNIQFSTQFAKTDSGTDFIDIWLRKNGMNVPMSNTQLRSWGNDDRQVAAWNFFVEAVSGDYYELAWHSNDKNITMLSTPSNGLPGIPSVILTVTQIR
jgi:hypothetical protein